MTPLEVAARIAARLDEDGVEYAIGGALALVAWAIPRDTKDVDLSIYVTLTELDRAFDALERAGVMLDRVEAARSVGRMGLFNGRCGRTNVDVFIGDHPHVHAMRRRRARLPTPNGELWFVSREDLCVLKLLYGRAKDLGDLERMFALYDDLDLDYMRDWLARLPMASSKLAVLEALIARFRG